MAGFITAEELMNYPLPVTDRQWDKIDRDQLDLVIEAATQNIKDYLDRDLEVKTYIERLRGNGRATLMLDAYPVVGLTSVTGLDIQESPRSFGTGDFLIHSEAGLIEWKDRFRMRFWKDMVWRVEYTAGMTSIPGPVKHATALQTIEMLQPLFRGGTNFAQISLVEDTNERIVDLLERYKRKRMG